TLQGNRNWTNARRSLLQSAKFGGPLDRLFPIVVPGSSDSGQFDNMLELLHLGGRSLPHAMMLMIPEAWEQHAQMDEARLAFYEYAGSLMEPWDGPAGICFSDGTLIGATLDRNGLRPLRWVETQDDRVVLASEAGVVDLPPEAIRQKGRLSPGRMFIVDTEVGLILEDDAVKKDIVSRWPYAKWLKRNVFRLADQPAARTPVPLLGSEQRLTMRAFGYTDEDLDLLILPMAEQGAEPVGSMGNDAPLAVLSRQAPSLYDYFHQQFAQVTNPAIDPIREHLVMSLNTAIGQDGNTFEETPEQCHRIVADGPILTNEELARIRQLKVGAFAPTTLSILCPADTNDPHALERAVERLCRAAEEAVDDGYNVLVLSDRGVDARHAPIPALLALSAVHQHLVREGTRLQTGLVIETGEAREVHHFALLLGYGAAAVNPWLVMDTLSERGSDGPTPELPVTAAEAKKRYVKAVEKGLLKIMSKMGISTLASYRGAQIFEAV
ncbi:MAG: glutamate synthase subunit alpha, partial [Myxococcales bacterium]|nr:glutamate synthase subunit alpha [Myxococcales bacterium]